MAQDVLLADLWAAREAMSVQPTPVKGHLAHITVVTVAMVEPSEAATQTLPVRQALLHATVLPARPTAAVVIAAEVVPSAVAAVAEAVPSAVAVVVVAEAVPSVAAAVAIDNQIMCSTHLYSTYFQNYNNENKIFFDCGCHAHRHDCHGTGNV